MPKHDNSNSEPYLVIPRRTLRSKELNALSVQARWVYVILCSEWRRNNKNNQFKFTYKQMREVTGFDDHRISVCIKELVKADFIMKFNHGGLERNPNEYRMNIDWLILKDKGVANNN